MMIHKIVTGRYLLSGFLLACSSLLMADALPDMTRYTDVNEKKQVFFDFIAPMAHEVNERIESERIALVSLYRKNQSGQSLSSRERRRLSDLADYYKVKAELASDEFFNTLLERVDTIPADLVLAQAANESAWGTSRFARQGNNLFGQWCFDPGCGLVPSGRPAGETYEVQAFDEVAESVDAYFRNLNTHSAYAELRQIRTELRADKTPLTGEQLAQGLGSYSIRGDEYIKELIAMINFNKLQRFNQPASYATEGL